VDKYIFELLVLAGLLKKECYFVGFMNNESWFIFKNAH